MVRFLGCINFNMVIDKLNLHNIFSNNYFFKRASLLKACIKNDQAQDNTNKLRKLF